MTTLVSKPVLHGRDHCHGGPDPIPCLPPAITGSFAERILAQPSLVGYWPFDDASGDAHDESGNSRPLSPVATPTYGVGGVFPDSDQTSILVEGVYEPSETNPTHDSFVGNYSALNLDGGAMTVLFYLYPTSYPGAFPGGITAHGGVVANSHTTAINTSGEILWSVATTHQAQTTGVSVPLSAWTFVACTRDSTDLKIYFDAELEATATSDAIAAVADDHFRVGCLVSASSDVRYYNGRVAHVALFNAALTQTEIATIYNGGDPGSGDAGNVLTIVDGVATWAAPTIEVSF